MAVLLWARLGFLLILTAMVGVYAWTAYRANGDGRS